MEWSSLVAISTTRWLAAFLRLKMAILKSLFVPCFDMFGKASEKKKKNYTHNDQTRV